MLKGNPIVKLIVMQRLQELDAVRKDLALNGSSTYEKLFENVLELAKNKNRVSILIILLMLGSMIIGFSTFPIQGSLISLIEIFGYDIMIFLIKNIIQKKINREKSKPYYNIASLDLFDPEHRKLNNDLIMLRNKVYFEYQDLLKQKEELGEDNIIYQDNNGMLDLSLDGMIPIVRVVIYSPVQLKPEFRNEDEQKINDEPQEPIDKTKSLGEHPQSKE